MSNWFSRLKEGLKKSSTLLGEGISKIFTHETLNETTLEELEDLLIQADLGISSTHKIIEQIRSVKFEKESPSKEILKVIAQEIEGILLPYASAITPPSSSSPFVIMMVGVNGTGKTTTLAKIASSFKDQGRSVLMVAGDTFRAAASEQLQTWGTRLNIPVLRREAGGDAAGLVFEAYQQALQNKTDILLIDTAGRLHTNKGLMEELAKINRVLKKINPTLPQECILVLDATTGQNAYAQVETFQKIINISGLIITKLDGTARGGVLVGLVEKFKLPIYALGVGEKKEDLHPFEAKTFSESLVGI